MEAAAGGGQVPIGGEIAEAEGVTRSFVNRLLRLTLLAPDIVEAILDGRQPKGLQLEELTKPMPTSSQEQGTMVLDLPILDGRDLDGGTSPARLRRHQAGAASLEVARTFLTRLRLAFFSSIIFRPNPICLANSDRRAA